MRDDSINSSIAIVGLSGRFPGAPDLETFWRNLRAGVESITRFTEEELIAAGVDEDLVRRPDYVKARAILGGTDLFDAEFFGYTPKEAANMDPQHRLFLECAWEALENAGCDPERYAGLIGVYAGQFLNTYLLGNLLPGESSPREFLDFTAPGAFQRLLGNDKDYLTSRVAYKLNLRGPAITVQTACSTSLVAICQACQSLLSFQCDLALAGGVALNLPEERGYLYEEGGIMSPDGHCRPFDANAQGTVFGNGVGVVALKRLSDALEDKDNIRAVIRGSALNNDGSLKVSYTAPSINGQAEVISLAMALAECGPDSVDYVETHGTGTPLGDPVEIAGLASALAGRTPEQPRCFIGSLKGNIGHLDVAAGVAGLIKTVLALEHGEIPPSLHFQSANPEIHLDSTPLQVTNSLQPWLRRGDRRRAGVSSFGVGGTNAHVIVEEAPDRNDVPSPLGPNAIVLSARTASALAKSRTRLAAWLEASPDLKPSEIAHTLQTGRKAFPFRYGFAAETTEQIKLALDASRAGSQAAAARPVIFLFPGQGSQSFRMAEGLYRENPVFRTAFDECAEILLGIGFEDLRQSLFGAEAREDALQKPSLAQPALFSVEYSLAKVWQDYGVQPAAMLGHSVGEYTAACLSGTFSLKDALTLVAKRATLVESQPKGAMLAIRLAERDLIDRIDTEIALAAVNGTRQCVAAGSEQSIATLESRLEADGVASKRLASTYAFHSHLVAGAVPEFKRHVGETPLHRPAVPMVSCISGDWLTEAQATDSEYWAEHLRRTVRFSDALQTILEKFPSACLIEVGPGDVLTMSSREKTRSHPGVRFIQSLRVGDRDELALTNAVALAWEAGVEIDWAALSRGKRFRKVALPTYPFERKSHWIAAPRPQRKSGPATIGEDRSASPPVAPNGTTAAANQDNRAAAQGTLAEVMNAVAELIGVPAGEIEPESTFLELGLDSLSLTQARRLFETRFGVRVLFRELLEQLNTPAKLAERLAAAASVRPADVSQTPPSELPHVPATEKNGAFGPYRSIQRDQAGEFSTQQRSYLEDFTSRYVARTAKSKAIAQRDRTLVADPRSVAGFRRPVKELVYQLTVELARGSRVWDIDGNEYVDITLGFGTNLFGHSPQFLTDALTAQLSSGFPIGPQSPLTGEIAELISRMTGMNRVTFCNTGSEAVMAAIRVARTVTGRDRVVYFSGSYHGTFDEVLFRPAGNNTYPIAPGIPHSHGADAVVLEYGSTQALEWIRTFGHELAAVLVEPVQSRNPSLQPGEFLQELREITRGSGTLLIFDEVISGFRLAPGGCQEYFGVKADLVTYGKVLGAGIPLGAIAGRGTNLDAIDGGYWQFGDDSVPEADITFFAGTFVRHPLALAAARATLLELQGAGPDLQRSLNSRTAILVGKLNEILAEYRVPLALESFSSLFRFRAGADPLLQSLFCFHLNAHGVYVRDPAQNSFLSTAHTEDDLLLIERAFRESARKIAAAGFLETNEEAHQAVGSDGMKVATSAAQREIWLTCQFSGEASVAYNESVTLEFLQSFEPARVASALKELVARHDALRMRFDPSGLSQRVASDVEDVIRIIALEAGAAAAKRASEVADEQIRRPFDLLSGPLIRATLLQEGERAAFLVLTVHHIVCDGWSLGILLTELAELLTGKPLPEQTEQFATYLRAHGRSSSRNAEPFWSDKLKGVPPVDLALKTSRPVTRSYRGDRWTTVIPEEEVVRWREVATRCNSTLTQLLVSAFQMLVMRFTGQEDFVIGLPVAAQVLTGMSAVVGHCVQLLPIRSSMKSGRAFDAAVRTTREELLHAQDHFEISFQKLVELAAVERTPSRPPLVNIVFNVDSSQPTSVGNEVFSVRHNHRHSYQFDLGFNVVLGTAGATLECDFATDLYDASTAAILGECFRRILGQAYQDSTTAVDDLPLAGDTPASLEHAVAFPDDRNLWQLFTETVQTGGERIAVREGERELTYHQLAGLAIAIGKQLQSEQFRAGDAVGVLAERSIEFVAAVLGIASVGAVYVPLGADYPIDRLTEIVAQTKIRGVIFTREVDRERAQTLGPALLVPRNADAVLPSEGLPVSPARPTDPIYIIHTSGTTGQPKGVVVPHQAVARLVRNSDYVRLSPDDCVAFASNPTFDAATFEIWGALLNGGRLQVIARDPLLSASALKADLESFGVSVLFLTTALFNQIASEAPDAFASLRTVLFGGESANTKAVNQVIRSCPPQRLLNVYGPTEVTTFATWFEITAEQHGPIPIGRPISNTTALVLDASRNICPPLAVGELYLGGPGLALGYFGDSALTEQKFIHTSFGRLYRTGDRARLLPNRNIEFLGRTDRQLKVRGFRIDPQEIEAEIRRSAAVKDCVVDAISTENEQAVLAAYLAIDDPINLPRLTADLRKTLPAFSVPQRYYRIASLPLNQNGKVDREALRRDATPLTTETADHSEPENALESHLIELWQELLAVSPIGTDDNFFELGGNSLLAAQLLQRVRDRFGYGVPFRVLFETPTIRHLATELISAQKLQASDSPFIRLNPTGTETPFFFFHGDFVGGGFYCRALADAVGPQRPFYAVQPHGVAGDSPASIAEMARERADQIRKIQPTGPYLLGGYCNGAFTAFEIARILQEEGQAVAALILVAADGSGYRLRHLRLLSGFWSRLRREDDVRANDRFLRWRHKGRLTAALARYYFAAESEDDQHRPRTSRLQLAMERLFARLQAGRSESSEVQRVIDGQQQPIADAYQNAVLGFVPRAFNGPAVLLWPQDETHYEVDNPAYGWSSVCTSTEVIWTPGDHHSCISKRSNLRALGKLLAESLSRTVTEPSSV